MQSRKFCLVVYMFIALVLTQLTQMMPLAFADAPKYEKVLKVVSGSQGNFGALTYGGHVVSEGFAVSISMMAAVEPNVWSFSRGAFAVSLGSSWSEGKYRYKPRVSKMWMNVSGDSNFQIDTGGIADNTGTGGDCTISWEKVLEILVNILPYVLAILAETPPREEWQGGRPDALHWAKAIVRSKVPYEGGRIQPTYNPSVRTAGCDFNSLFLQNGYQYLTITAGADICLVWSYVSQGDYLVWGTIPIGMYSVTCEVEVPVTNAPNDPETPSGDTSVFRCTTHSYSTRATDPDGDNIRFQFDWGDGYTTTTGWYTSGSTASASHTWGSSGTYDVEVRAQDVYGENSSWSPHLTVNVVESTLVTILNTLGFTNIQESTVETFVPGAYTVRLYAEFSGQHAQNELSWYKVGTIQYNQIFSGPEGNLGYVDPPIVKTITINDQFGLSLLSWPWRYFTETSRNLIDGIKHAMIYENLDNPNMYLIGFEDQLGGGDQDYNDMVVSITKLVNLNLVVKVPQAPQEGVKVWVDDNTYTAYESAPVSIVVDGGEYEIEVQNGFIEEGWVEGTYYIYTFDHWSDGSTDNPRTIHLTSDTTLTAYYLRSKYGILRSEEPQ